jgi:hypothetical protein
MPENVTTEDLTLHPAVERDEWELAFEPFEGEPYAALKMGFNLAMLRKHFHGQLFKSRPVMEALDQAMEVLFPYTEFHKASFDLFIRFTEGKLTFEEEQMLHALGVKF